jgi:hypothetical protein
MRLTTERGGRRGERGQQHHTEQSEQDSPAHVDRSAIDSSRSRYTLDAAAHHALPTM